MTSTRASATHPATTATATTATRSTATGSGVRASKTTALAAGIAVAVSACSFSFGTDSPEDTGERAVEGELAELLGLELSDATCTAPREDEPGEEFTCSATTDGGETVTILGVVEPENSVFVAASNVVVANDMDDIEREAVVTLAPEVNLPEERITAECPVGPVVLDDGALVCEISDTSTGERFDLIVELSDFVLREGWNSRFYRIGEQLG